MVDKVYRKKSPFVANSLNAKESIMENKCLKDYSEILFYQLQEVSYERRRIY